MRSPLLLLTLGFLAPSAAFWLRSKPLWAHIRSQDSRIHQSWQNDLEVRSEKSTNLITEKIGRDIPFADIGLPLLGDTKNYYCGQFGDCFWYQNADQVYSYIPLPKSVEKCDILVELQPEQITVHIRGEKLLELQLPERIIVDGSFWMIEHDLNGKAFLLLDLEKRYRMINWKSLFGSPSEEEDVTSLTKSRANALEKLFSANQGLSHITGLPPESVDSMLQDAQLMSSLSEVQPTVAVGQDELGKISNVDSELVPLNSDFERNAVVNILENSDSSDTRRSDTSSDIIDIEWKNANL